MRLNQKNPAVWMGGKGKAFEAAMGYAGTAFRGFHDGHFRLGGPWGDGTGNGAQEDERAESWKAMLEALFGEVPEGEEMPPPCDFLMMPEETAHRYCAVPAQLPPAVGRVEDFPFPVRNQFDRGACFAFAMTALCEHGFAKLGRKTALSEQSLYCFTKQETRVEVDEQEDGVERLRDAVRAVEKWGIAPLGMWPYDPNADGWNFVNYAGDCVSLVQAASAFRWGYWKAFRGNSVPEMKEWLAKGHPVCIGVHTTPVWQADAASSKGTIPYFPQHWRLSLDTASAFRAAEAMCAGAAADDEDEGMAGEKQDDEEQGELENLLGELQGAGSPHPMELLEETQNRLMGLLNTYTGQPVSHGDWRDEGRTMSLSITLAPTGGHAICLLGYQDDEDWAGGGYFVARNSWGEDWGWPEYPGHGRIPYEYIVQMGLDAYVMLYEAEHGIARSGVAGGRQAFDSTADGQFEGTKSRVAALDGFERWLAANEERRKKPIRDNSGVLCKPGTPKHQMALRAVFEAEEKARIEAAEAERIRDALAAKAAKEAALLSAVREVVDNMLADGQLSICPGDILSGLQRRGFGDIDQRSLRPVLLALQDTARNRYAFCVNRFGDEELRPSHLLGDNRRITG